MIMVVGAVVGVMLGGGVISMIGMMMISVSISDTEGAEAAMRFPRRYG